MMECRARGLCLAENPAGQAVLQLQKAAEKADSLTTHIVCFCCAGEEMAEDLVPVSEIPIEHQEHLCCGWK